MDPTDLETPERTYSIEEYERLPEEPGWRVELVEGKLVRDQIPSPEHGWLTVELGMRLQEHVRRHRLGLMQGNTGFVLADDPPTVRGPDLAFIARGNLPEGGLPRSYWRIPPDLAVEVVSPSNTRAEIREKSSSTSPRARGWSGSSSRARGRSPPTARGPILGW